MIELLNVAVSVAAGAAYTTIGIRDAKKRDLLDYDAPLTLGQFFYDFHAIVFWPYRLLRDLFGGRS